MRSYPAACRRPKILANIVMSVDGKIPTEFHPQDIFTSKDIKRRFADIRARGNAVLTSAIPGDSDSPPLLLRATKNSNSLTRDLLLSPKIRNMHSGAIPMPTLLEMLFTIWGVKTLICEVGMPLLKSLLEEDFVDELYLTILPVICGGAKSAGLTGEPGSFLRNERYFRLLSLKQGADIVYLHYIRVRKKR